MNIKLLIAASITLLFACGSPNSESAKEDSNTEMKTEELNSENAPTTSSEGLVSKYINLKDALVSSNVDEVKTAAAQMHHIIMNEEGQDTMTAGALSISKSDNIDVQREAFSDLTLAFISYVKANNVNAKLYVQYCPMAFNNTGASWVSLSSEIRNPYFGDKMLKCGRIEEEL